MAESANAEVPHKKDMFIKEQDEILAHICKYNKTKKLNWDSLVFLPGFPNSIPSLFFGLIERHHFLHHLSTHNKSVNYCLNITQEYGFVFLSLFL